MQKSIIKLLIGCFFWIPVAAQNEYSLSGIIKDADTGEDLTGATVIVESEADKGTISNNYGFYSITLLQGKHHIRYQYVGYESIVLPVNLQQNIQIDIELHRISYELGDVNVLALQADKNVTSTEMGIVQLQPENIESLPVLFGEADIIKVLQLTAGVQPAGDGNSGFHVRGGGVDQNLILQLEEVFLLIHVNFYVKIFIH